MTRRTKGCQGDGLSRYRQRCGTEAKRRQCFNSRYRLAHAATERRPGALQTLSPPEDKGARSPEVAFPSDGQHPSYRTFAEFIAVFHRRRRVLRNASGLVVTDTAERLNGCNSRHPSVSSRLRLDGTALLASSNYLRSRLDPSVPKSFRCRYL